MDQSQDSPTSTPNPSGSQASAGKPTKKKTSPMQAKARSTFNASAPSMSVERFFTDFIELKRNNVDIVMDESLQDRISEPYVSRAQDHANYKLRQDVESVDLQSATHALISLTLVRKLMMATPQSEEYELHRFRNIVTSDLYAPKSLIAAVDNVGKFELDDFTARIKYSAQDVFRSMIRMCQVMNRNTKFRNRFTSPIMDKGGSSVPWEQVPILSLVITSESSVRWIRDESVKYLDKVYQKTWTVKHSLEDGTTVEFEVSYPRLEISMNPDRQLVNVVAWLKKLHEMMPDVDTVVAAGLCTCWKLSWFQRVGHLFSILEPEFPDWIDFRPYDALRAMGLYHCDIATDDYDGMSYVGMVREIHRYITSSVPIFAEFLELARQPENKFGTAAQLLPYDPEDLVERKMMGMLQETYQSIRTMAHSTSVSKIKNKGQVVAGLIFGFSKEVVVRNNYLARTNGDPNNIRNQFLKSDFKNY